MKKYIKWIWKNIGFCIFIITVTVILVTIIHMLTFDSIIDYKNISFSSPKIPAELNGYKIAFVTDTHSISENKLQNVVKKLNDKKIDLLVLGGDYTSLNESPVRIIKALSEVKATDGIYGVDGNHDNYSELSAAFEEYSVNLLSNSGLYIQKNFYFAGVDDLWNRNPNIATATKESFNDDFVLLVSHNPDVTMLQDTTGVDLILSGHTHGGQVTLFYMWAPIFDFNNVITKYGNRFRSGWSLSKDDVPVYVSNGTGQDSFRTFCRPQVIILTLSHELK